MPEMYKYIKNADDNDGEDESQGDEGNDNDDDDDDNDNDYVDDDFLEMKSR